MNMSLHNMDNARIEWCNTLTSPKLIEDNKLMKFNIVVANPPLRSTNGGGDRDKDPYRRFGGTPPKSKADYAFISHMIEIAIEDEARLDDRAARRAVS